MISFKKFIKIILLIGLFLFFISYFKKNDLPQPEFIINFLYNEPRQEKIELEPFELQKEEFTYEIYPLYSYELYGLIVADYDSENWLDFSHRHDPFNIKDICLIWGDNVKSDIYKKIEYSHGEFTCYYQCKDNSYYQQFSHWQFSNNHLLANNDEIYKRIKKAKVGDQIYLKGYLVNYSVKFSQGNFIGTRNTSTVRTDSGNGACEVIYVNEFKILREENYFFVLISELAKWSIIICFFLLIINFFKNIIMALIFPKNSEGVD